MKQRPPTVKAALLGVDHPHSPYLLRSLQNSPEVHGILVWNETPGPDGALPWRDAEKVELVTGNLAALIARDDVNFAILCMRTDRVAEIARQVIRAGKALLIDKPAGLNSSQIRQLGALASQQGTPVAVYYGQRSHPAVQEARRRVAAGLLGRLLTVEARMVTTQVRFRDPASWLFQRSAAGGGILTWLGCHYLDLIPHLLGDDITAVSAQLGTFSGEAIDVEDAASLTLRFKSGAIGTFHAGYLLAGRGTGYRNPAGFDNYLACNGRDGRIVWRGVTSRSLHVESTPAHSGLLTLQRLCYRLKKTESYGGAVGEAFLRQFLAALRAEADLPATLGDALRAILVVEAAQRSAATQQTELVGS